MRKTEIFRRRKSERGAAMLESMLAMLLLLLVLCGFLQVIYFYIAQYFVEYAAIRGARSRSVGFSDSLANREARIHVIGASGKMVIPKANDPTDENGKTIELAYDASNSTREKTLIQRYMTGITYIEYENWNGNNSDSTIQTTFHTSFKNTDSNMLSFSAVFKDYVFFEKFTRHLFFNKNVDLTATAEVANYSNVFLE